MTSCETSNPNPNPNPMLVLLAKEIITFCVSRRRRKMYCGHARLCVCLSVCLCVCLSVCPRPYAHSTARTRMQLGGMVEAAP